METNTVYRVQMRGTGQGPYRWQLQTGKEILPMAASDSHPSPHDEWMSFWTGKYADYKFACPTLDALVEWFGPYWDQLEKEGFEIVEIRAKEVILGTYSGLQCLYKE